MTPDELKAIEEYWSLKYDTVKAHDPHYQNIPRLITALKESQAEVERLKREELIGIEIIHDTTAKTEGLKEENARYREALKFYATGEHYGGFEEWDTVSGEPENWICPAWDCKCCDDRTEMLEIGEVARTALSHETEKESK